MSAFFITMFDYKGIINIFLLKSDFYDLLLH